MDLRRLFSFITVALPVSLLLFYLNPRRVASILGSISPIEDRSALDNSTGSSTAVCEATVFSLSLFDICYDVNRTAATKSSICLHCCIYPEKRRRGGGSGIVSITHRFAGVVSLCGWRNPAKSGRSSRSSEPQRCQV